MDKSEVNDGELGDCPHYGELKRMVERRISDWKKQTVQRISERMRKYDVIAVADLMKVRSSQIHEIRKRLRGKIEMLVAKNTIVKKSAESIEDEKNNIAGFGRGLRGSGILLFSNLNPFSLMLLLNKSKVRVAARAGDVASGDIIVPAGNTGIPPGPIIGEFGELKVPTKIESGSIWISKDTVVARKGDVISPKLASLLSKLGMKPMEAGLTLVCAYDHGTVLNSEDLKFDLTQYERNLQEAFMQAMTVAVSAGYVLPETTPLILGKAYRNALALSLEAEYFCSETATEIIRKAYQGTLVLSSKISEINREAAP